jgi:spore coat polysaccharide biosynthesis predicted glycosyltransferase SpsG
LFSDVTYFQSVIPCLEFSIEFQSNQLIYQKEYTKRQQTIYHLKEVGQYASSRNNITLHINSNSIAQLMNNANFAIVTPRVTINEILYLGIPFIVIQTAENQKYMSDFIKKHNHQILKKFSKIELKYSLKKFT